MSLQQSPQKSLQRTLSDESLCSGRREPSLANPAGLEPGLPSDVLFSSTCAFPSSTLPARRQHQHPHPPGGGSPSTGPATSSGFPEKKCEHGRAGAGGGLRQGREAGRQTTLEVTSGGVSRGGELGCVGASGGSDGVTHKSRGWLAEHQGVSWGPPS